MNKKYLIDLDHINNINTGLSLVYNMVSKTMGPCGSNVFIDRQYLNPIVTKDGATVADHINCDKEDYAAVVNLVKTMTRKASFESGDGTTTTTVLTYALFNEFMNEISDKKSIRILKVTDYIRSITNKLVEELKHISKKITTKEELKNIILISTNQDEYVTDMLLECLNIKTDSDVADAINRDIVVSFSRTGKDYIEKIEGSRYDSPVASQAFFNNKNRTKAIVENPFLFITNAPVMNMKQIYDVLLFSKQNSRPLVIIAPEYDNNVLVTLASNKLHALAGSEQGVDVTAIIAPGSGGPNTEAYLEDIAVLAGCKVSKPESEFSFDKINVANAPVFQYIIGGLVSKLEADNTSFSFISNQSKDIINDYINDLKEQHKDESSAVKKDTLERRISKLKNGLSNFYITADSDIEMNERKDRIDDAIGSIKSALEEGYIAGSGTTLLKLTEDLNRSEIKEEQIATNIIKKALKAPFKKIMENAELLNNRNVIEMIESNSIKYGEGIDLFSGNKINLFEAGVIDPTKVLRCALQYSISLTSTLISSKASIILDKEDGK